jgi:hypothetical protein
MVKHKLNQDPKALNLVSSKGITDSMLITLGVQIEELKNWDKSAYKFIQLMCLLPKLTEVSVWKNCWIQFDPNHDIEPIIEKLKAKGLLIITESEIENDLDQEDTIRHEEI